MRTTEDIIKSLTESVVFEWSISAGLEDLHTVRRVTTQALRKALPPELKALEDRLKLSLQSQERKKKQAREAAQPTRMHAENLDQDPGDCHQEHSEILKEITR